MDVKFFSKQSPDIKPPHAILQSQSLKMVSIEVVINVVIGRLSGDDLKCLARVTVRLQPTVRLQL